MRSRHSLSPSRLVTLAGLVAVMQFVTVAAAHAQAAGFQEYYVIGRESHVYNMMERVATAEGGPLGTNSTHSVVSMVSSSTGQQVFYDHWEDGLDVGLNSSNILFPSATQPTMGAAIAGTIVRAGNIVTVTAAGHGYATGNVVVIAAGAPAGYNGAFLITVTGANTFTYQVHAGLAAITDNTITAVRRSTMVLGDGDLSNGRACDFTNDPRVAPCDGNAAHDDALFDGTAVTLDSPTVALPRSAAALHWDGGDRIASSGGPLSLIHNQDPQSNFIGGSVEVLSRQAYANATSYSIPAGENLFTVSNTLYNIFQYVDIDVVAFQDNTSVTITSPGAGGGTVSFTLNQGQHYTNRGCTANPTCPNGLIDDATLAPFIRINSGTKIATTGPLAGMIHAGGDGNYATDIFPILPDLLHGNDYLIPSLGDDPAVNGNRPMNLYLFNPDPVNTITVTATDSVGSRTFTVGPNATENYNSDAAPNRFVPANSAVRLTSSANFWGLTSHDHQSPANDWGYAWLATKFLTSTYTAGYSPGVRNPPAQYAARVAACQGGTPLGSDGAGSALNPATCDTFNRSPVWVGATSDATRVKVDFNGDGLYDYIDLNSDDFPDDGAFNDGTCAPAVDRPAALQDLNNCVYSINALQALRVYDWTDYDNTGTQIVANKPVSVVYGQDTDQATGGDPIQDTGYTIYPSLQAFLDPVLTIAKAASPTSVSGISGGVVTFTLTVKSYLFGGLTNLTVSDDLPAGLTCTALAGNYVPGSSRITYPNLSQQVGDVPTGAACAPGAGPGGRHRLSWTISPNTLGESQTLTVEFQLNIPAGAATTFINDATARVNLGTSIFEATAQANVVRTNVVFTKSVVDNNGGQPEFGDTLTYTLIVTNNGAVAETAVTVRDTIPASTVFLGSITSTGVFTGAYSPGQNAVVWTNSGGPFAAGASVTLSFQVTVNSGNPAAGAITNFANYSSALTPSVDSNTVSTAVVSPVLEQTKTGPSILSPGEVAPFEILVQNTGAGSATNVLVRDPMTGTNMTYLAGSMSYSLNGGPFLTLLDGAADDPAPAEGALAAGPIVQLLLDTLGPGGELRFRFRATVNAGTGGSFATNQASVSATQVASEDTNLLQIPIGNATVTGHLFLDLDGNGSQGGSEPNLPNVTVTLVSAAGGTRTLVTDANGNYSAIMRAGNVTATVDGADPDIPPSSVLTTAVGCVTPGTGPCNNIQTVVGVANASVATTNVGYQPPPVQITKSSSAGGTVVPGQVVTYTVTVTNNTPSTQTAITLNDVVPVNTTYVDNTAVVTAGAPAIRVTEYYIDGVGTDQCVEAGTDFTEPTCTMTLNQSLANDYFVLVHGSRGDAGGARNPEDNYAALTGAPAGTPGVGAAGGLAPSGALDRIVLSRNDASGDWRGVITVVECVSDCDTNGFRLRDADRVTVTGSAGAADSDGTAWGTLGRVVLFGGANGAGCTTNDGDGNDHEVCHLRLQPSGTNTINWQRFDNNASTTVATVMSVEFGSSWGVQRVRVGPAPPTVPAAANNGGDGLNGAGEYNTTAIASVTRARTWVWGTGFTNDPDTGESAEAAIVTLGPGFGPQNANEGVVAVGTEEPDGGGGAGVVVDFDVYVMTHPQLVTGWLFKADGDNAALTVGVATAAATANRMALVYNGNSDADTEYPRSIFSARYTSNTNIELGRWRAGSDFPAWVQGINFNAIGIINATCNGNNTLVNQCSEPANNPNVLVPSNGFTLLPGRSLTLSYQVTVNNPLSLAVTQISNTAGASTALLPGVVQATVTDNVSQPGVTVEPNNAGFAAVPPTVFGTPILFTQGVTNRGTGSDSFRVTLDSELANWKLELLDPATGAVLATDTNGDGVWDGGITVSTGSLASGATRNYIIRATVPFGTGAGAQNTVELTAVSALASGVSAVGTNEVTVLPASTFGPVVLLPDHSGVVAAGETVAYTHRIFNNTGAAETFDLTLDVTAGWPTTIRADTNGDGVYTPGVDLAITNTAQLPNGGSQILFVVTTAPNFTPAGTTEVAHLTARSRSNPVLVDAVTDTTTILAATTHDLAGGGTRMAAAGEATVFPGTLYNLSSTVDRYDFSLTPSSLFGVDGYNHPTELRVGVDGNADGVLDTLVATDADGDGTWDTINPAFETNANGLPDLQVPGNGSLNYQLVRAIDPAQAIWKEYVTVTATSISLAEKDSVTAQWIIAALSRASIRGLRVDPAGVIEFVTGTQQNTAFFNLYETAERSLEGERTLLNATPVVSPAPDSLLPILYRVETAPIKGPYLLIEETETTGNVFLYGPYSIANTRLKRGLDRVEAQMNAFGVPQGPVRVSRQSMARIPGAADPTVKQRRRAALSRLVRIPPATAPRGIVIEVEGQGEAAVPLRTLTAQGLPSPAPPEETLRLWREGQTVPVAIGSSGGVSSLIFTAWPMATDYTDKAAYILTWGGIADPPSPTVPLTRSADPDVPGFTRVERNSIYAASVPAQSDPWQWDLMSPMYGPTWPYPCPPLYPSCGWPTGDFDLPNVVASPAPAAVRIRLVGMSDHHHTVTAQINGQTVGSVTFFGRTKALLEGSITSSALTATANKLTLVHLAQNENGTSAPAGYAYLDYVEIAAQMTPGPSTAVVTNVRPFLRTPLWLGLAIPEPAGIEYLILTHSAFRPQADRLAALKKAERIRAAVVDVDAAYDLFSAGVAEPQAIAAMIRHTATLSPGLQYVVLFGDDSLDPRNYLGGGNPTFVPSIMGHDGSSRIPNENAYADLNGDGAPELAIGRLPVTTLAEAVAVVDKIETQSATLAASGHVHLFVSDDSRQRDIHFGDSAREMSEKLPLPATSILADVGGGIGPARSAMFGTWQTGTTITHYFGHGGPEIWTDEALFSTDDVPDLPAAMSPMILLAWACQSQYYQNYYGPSVNEALFLAPGTGSLASFGPVGISSPAHQRMIYERVYERLYTEGLSLGEIIRQAKVEALAADPLNQDAVDGFMFFGDPSLKLPQPRRLGRPGPRLPRP